MASTTKTQTGLTVQTDLQEKKTLDLDEARIPLEGLSKVFGGVLKAGKMLPKDDAPMTTDDVRSTTAHLAPKKPRELVQEWLDESSTPPEATEKGIQYSWSEWRNRIASHFPNADSPEFLLAELVLAITLLRQASNEHLAIPPATLALIWSVIHNALTTGNPPHLSSFVAQRSSQGFLAVPLCSITSMNEDGIECIEVLIRLHVWLPDGQRGTPAFAVHPHQSWAQSWILAGTGVDHTYTTEDLPGDAPTARSRATHHKYGLQWDDKPGYSERARQSTIVNTKQLVRAERVRTAAHTRDMSYSIPAAHCHVSEVAPDALHATLFFFNSSHGFVLSAPVLGPIDGRTNPHNRDPGRITAHTLAAVADAARRWDILMDAGRAHARRAAWEYALRAFNTALELCGGLPQNAARYHLETKLEIGKTYRRFGRYADALRILGDVLAESALPGCLLRVEASGELGAVLRHMGRLEDAKRAFESQREAAAALDSNWHLCRAVGNLGMVNFQLYKKDPVGNRALLETARDLQIERVGLARSLGKNLGGQATRTDDLKVATVWETIGLSRLSLCFSELGSATDAVAAARESLDRAIASGDPTVVGMSRFFLVRALLGAGQADQAKQALAGPESESCTPAMALCKEPSEEHHGYLRETIKLGVDLDKRDDQGYSALDYAVFSGDKEMEKLVLEGLQRDLPNEACANRMSAAYRRKYYRELFQEEVRPLLLENQLESQTNLQSLRKVFANALRDEDKAKMFDRFRFVRYADFKKHGRLPRSDDKLAHVIDLDDKLEEETYVVFISYRWINESSGATSPDNADHTQYRRMLEAIKAFLEENPTIDPTKLGIWLDFACVDQNSPSSGVNALPMSLMQCNALISLVDKEYYTRAWCSIEALMIQTLRRAWGLHAWYVFDGQGKLLLQPPDREVVAGERLTYEEDRPLVQS